MCICECKVNCLVVTLQLHLVVSAVLARAVTNGRTFLFDGLSWILVKNRWQDLTSASIMQVFFLDSIEVDLMSVLAVMMNVDMVTFEKMLCV